MRCRRASATYCVIGAAGGEQSDGRTTVGRYAFRIVRRRISAHGMGAPSRYTGGFRFGCVNNV